MKNIDKEFELLIAQRNQLVDALSRTNSTFQKVLFAIFTGLVSIIVADSLDKLSNKIWPLFLIQIIIMLIFFITALLISGNAQRYYISAIDDYIWEEYGISVLFYQGKMSRVHTIGRKSFFTFITYSVGILATILAIWLIIELGIWTHIEGNILYIFLLIAEITVIVIIVAYNLFDKNREPKIYKECLSHLRRKRTQENETEENTAN